MSTSSSSSRRRSSSSPVTPPASAPTHYAIGTFFIAKRHTPSPPFGHEYSNMCEPNKTSFGTMTKLDWCLSHPPLPGTTHPEDTHCFTIAQAMSTGDARGAQVFRTSDGLVAKIYDPMHYSFREDAFGDKSDVVANADRDYTIEAAAYQELRGSHCAGSITPNYLGSWTLDIPTMVHGKEILREVRMILVEYIEGTCMLTIDPGSITSRARENIMFKVIEADMDLLIAGVRHDDLEPRNVILVNPSSSSPPLDFESPDLRVYLIDFNLSTVSRIVFGSPLRRPCHNPLHYWVGASLWSDWGWLPRDDEATEWMWKIWGNGRDGKYVAAERNPASPLGCPKVPVFDKQGPECPEAEVTAEGPTVQEKEVTIMQITAEKNEEQDSISMEDEMRLSGQESQEEVAAHDKDEDKVAETEPKVCVMDYDQVQDTT